MMMMFLGLLISSIGGVYVAYGRRKQSAIWLVAGAALIVFPYFFSHVVVVIAIAAALAILPIAHERGWLE